MDLKQIQTVATYQTDNWDSFKGQIQNYDLSEGVLELEKVDESNVIEVAEFKLNPNSQTQVLERLGLKGTYADFIGAKSLAKWKMSAEQMQSNIDYRIKQMQESSRVAPTQVIYDTKTMHAKAVKSDQYVRLPNKEVLDRTIAKYGENFNHKNSWIDDKRMNISFSDIDTRWISKKEISERQLQQGDAVSFGIQVSNSDTGYGSLMVGQFMVRLACTNGMTSRVAMDIERMIHVHNDLMVRLDYALDHIVEPGTFAKTIQSAMNRPAIIKTIDEFPTIIKNVPKIHKAGIMLRHENDPIGVNADGINPWGVFNAITGYASNGYTQSENYDRKVANELMYAAYPLLKIGA